MAGAHMLWMTIQNIRTDEHDMADYKVNIMDRSNVIIWRGTVERHYRPEGWTRLLRRIADEAERDGQDGALTKRPVESP
jgi:hypothetical protein